MRSRKLALAGGLAVVLVLAANAAAARAVSGSATGAGAAPVVSSQDSATAGGLACGGGAGPIQHVIYIQFDNTHLLRDRPDVPSDLEQMPHLLNFMRRNGTLLSNDHTVLISHTANGILSSLTGVYPDRQGQAVSNTASATTSRTARPGRASPSPTGPTGSSIRPQRPPPTRPSTW